MHYITMTSLGLILWHCVCGSSLTIFWKRMRGSCTYSFTIVSHFQLLRRQQNDSSVDFTLWVFELYGSNMIDVQHFTGPFHTKSIAKKHIHPTKMFLLRCSVRDYEAWCTFDFWTSIKTQSSPKTSDAWKNDQKRRVAVIIYNNKCTINVL